MQISKFDRFKYTPVLNASLTHTTHTHTHNYGILRFTVCTIFILLKIVVLELNQ